MNVSSTILQQNNTMLQFLRCVIISALLNCGGVVHGAKKNIRPQLFHSWEVEDGKSVFIFDHVIDTDKLMNLQLYFLYPRKMKINFVHQNFVESMGQGLTPFNVMANKTEFSNFAVFKNAKSLIKKSLGKEIFLEKAYAEVLHSLDPKPPVTKNCEDGSYIATVFLANDWKHNSYGQISFYTLSRNRNITEESRLEISQTVHPKPGRMVVWPSCLTYCHHPPSVNYFGNLATVTMEFSTNELTEDPPKQNEKDEKNEFGDFKFPNKDSDRKIDYEKHLKRKYYDSQKRGIYVFDDLYTTEELRAWRDHLLNVGRPGISHYDFDLLEDHDNVQWIVQYNVSQFLQTPVWQRVEELLEFVGEKNKWYPYDVALNLVRPADHTRIHPDAEHHQHEYTYLLYLTEGITQNDFGETVWFEQNYENLDGIHQFTHPGGEEYDPIAAVWPKFGRVVIFQNVIEHSARPLSTSHLGCRYSFAVKSSINKRSSVIKQMYEMMETTGDMDRKTKKLNEQLQSGMHDDEQNSPLTNEVLENRFSKLISRRSKYHRRAYENEKQQLL
uniref:uncharacterized protein LOC120342750 n=1 Tax=Styela clava TaxID=7725 RepID=UPI001939E7EA|nr:uncharacterized protein LOC120342750 [Styela clava]